MDKTFHVYVRHLPGGVSVSVLGHPHLTSFASSIDAARRDLAHVLGKLVERGELAEETHYPDARLKRVELGIRAVQRGRLLEVPMRFSVATWSTGKGKPHRVLVPRLGLDETIADALDVMPFVEELIRHALYLAPLERLTQLTWLGDEALDTLTISAKLRDPAPAKAAEERKLRPPPPHGLGEASRRLSDEREAGTLGRAFERDEELERLTDILGARTGASVLLVGPPGAGKTALVHELVHRAGESNKVGPLAGLEVYSTSGARIVAGMRYLGEWQGRVQRMLAALRGSRGVLHVESLAELLSVGGDADGLDVARFLLPALEAGEVTMIFEATPEDAARAERSHAALVQALRRVVVAPLAPVAARAALAQTAAHLGRRRRVKFDDGALERALDLSERFGSGVLPGAAAELLRAAAAPPATHVGAAEVTLAFAKRTGYPAALVDPSVQLDPAAVVAALRARVDGQDHATELLANVVVTLKTNLADPRRPLGTFLLLGPTGVGKTESALALAGYLFGADDRLARFDMAEYAAPGSAARLVAAGGGTPSLARRVREQPFGVVLLDEIEKADGGVHDLLLQVLGEGRLSDATGRTVSFRNTIVILTSNLGADGVGRSLGFGVGGVAAADAHYRAAAAAFFRPELINRLDQIVPYRPLGPEVVARLAGRVLGQALAREGLLRRGVTVDIGDGVVLRLAELGFDPRLGARPLKRAVETHVIAPLARLLARHGARAPARFLLELGPAGEIRVRSGDGARA